MKLRRGKKDNCKEAYVLVVKNPSAHAGDVRDLGSIPGIESWSESLAVFL